MRSNFLLALVLGLLVALAAAWDKDDHEIFRLNDEVTTHFGHNTTFYSLLSVSPRASQEEINKAYRKKSRQMHPDKARQAFIASYALQTPKPKAGEQKKVYVRKQPSKKEIDAYTKEAAQKFAILGTVTSILRGPARERYDFFLRNGFPKWRGTGYYYSRFRPGLASVLVGLLVVFGGAAHYGALYLGWKRQRDFVQRYIRHARRMAWGDELGIQGIPGASAAAPVVPSNSGTDSEEAEAMPRNRRERRFQEKEARKGKNAKAAKVARTSGISTPTESELTSGPKGTKKRVQAENGKILVVDSVGNVYLEETTEEGQTHEFLLDVDEIPRPTMYDTLLFRLPLWAFASIGRLVGKERRTDLLEDEVLEDPAENEEKVLNTATAPNANGESRKRKSKATRAR